jgi:hypothetical protein
MKTHKKPVPSVELRCGCVVPFVDGETAQCLPHREMRIVQTRAMPPPRFRGVASGPHVTTMDLGAYTGRIAGSEPPQGRHG